MRVHDLVLAQWSEHFKTAQHARVVPDGCRDLIVLVEVGERPVWFVSQLDDQVREVPIEAGAALQGFRLRPGVRIDEDRLLSLVQSKDPGAPDVVEQIHHCCALSSSVVDALEGLASDGATVRAVTKQLGTSVRSMERLLSRETGHSPMFWLQLARTRKAARAVQAGLPLSEASYRYGFSDQSHMTREFRRWLDLTPASLGTAGLDGVLEQSGYP